MRHDPWADSRPQMATKVATYRVARQAMAKRVEAGASRAHRLEAIPSAVLAVGVLFVAWRAWWPEPVAMAISLAFVAIAGGLLVIAWRSWHGASG